MSGKGAGPLMWEAPTLEIAGRKVKVLRLGLPQVQRIARVYAAASAYMDRTALANMGSIGPEALGTFIIDAMANAFDEVVELLASVIDLEPGVTEERWAHLKAKAEEAGEDFDDPNVGTVRDPDVFPLGSEIMVVQAIIEHQDVEAFFDHVQALMKTPALKKLTKRLSARSTASKAGTDGATETS